MQGIEMDVIMEQTGFSSTAIWNILRTPQALEIVKAVHARVIRNGHETLPDKIAAIQFQALDNIAEFIGDKEMAKKNPFAFYDRSIKAAELTASLQKKGLEPADRGGVVNNTQINAVIVSPEHQKALGDGLSRAVEAARLHQALPSGSVGNLASLDSGS